jgi:hypothetical protein
MHRSRHSPHRTERREENCASGGRFAGVAVMESPHQGQADDVALVGWFNRTRFRRILVQRPMGGMLMIITEIVPEPPPQGLLVEDEYVVQTLAADGADQPLDEGILPWGARRNEFLFQAQVPGAAQIPHRKCHRDCGADSVVDSAGITLLVG